MADPHVISALTAKRAELSGELIAAEKRVLQLRDDINSLDRTIRVFAPTSEPHTENDSMRTADPFRDRWFESGFLQRGVCEPLVPRLQGPAPAEAAHRTTATSSALISSALRRIPNAVKSAALLGEHIAEALAD
jgi:hypothetical protein